MTPLAGLNGARVQHQEAHAQADPPFGAGKFRKTAVQSRRLGGERRPQQEKRQARWVPTEQELFPRQTVSATSCPRGNHGIP
jgi:hypothetical protein